MLVLAGMQKACNPEHEGGTFHPIAFPLVEFQAMKRNARRFAIFCIAVLWGGTAFSAEIAPKKPAIPEPAKPDRLEFAAELKKVQGTSWESSYINGMKVQVQIQKGKATIAMFGKGKQADSMRLTEMQTEAIEEGEERIIVLKNKTKTRLFSYSLDGKDLTIVFGEHLQAKFNEQAFDLPETVTMKTKGRR